MANQQGVWGIDIGQCALKALRCTNDGSGQMVVDAFDFIEYPKILSQPKAEPEELIREALEQFLSRNNTDGDKVAVSVAGQNGLARFFKPPPVDAKKIPDIVKYEAKQQIPFELTDVIWDYQRIGGSEVDGVMLETEIGLFAMKRDQVFRCIEPFRKGGIELDIVQLAPFSIYNFVSHCLLADGPTAEEYDPESPPDSVVVISVGTDTTDLVITNGFRVWQRNIPIGGNQFTKQLTKELKLTYAKAEHLKRNARQSEDAKTIIQTMRPVFNDLLTQVQRTLNFFMNIDKNAKLTKVVMLGNAMKLPGLQHYLAKNLDLKLVELDADTWRNRISGPAVLSAPPFKENILSLGVCYGLCLQGLNEAPLQTNLLPAEIITQRLIRQKKPWAVAGVAALMFGCAVNYAFYFQNWYKVNDSFTTNDVSWKDISSKASSVTETSRKYKNEHKTKLTRHDILDSMANEVAGNSDRRLLWPELLGTITRCMPRTEGVRRGEYPDPAKIPYDRQAEIRIEYIESEHFDDLSVWFLGIQEEYKKQYPEKFAGAAATQAASPRPTQPATGHGAGHGAAPTNAPTWAARDNAKQNTAAAGAQAGPTGAGWVIEIAGFHYHNRRESLGDIGGQYLKRTFMKNLESMRIPLPSGGNDRTGFTTKEMGIDYVFLFHDPKVEWTHTEPNPNAKPGTNNNQTSSQEIPGLNQTPDDTNQDAVPSMIPAPRYEFVIQFVWQERPLGERLLAREEAEKAKAAAAAQAQAQPNQPGAPQPGPATPQPGPAAPQPGPAAPQPGPATPQPGPAAPQPGPAAPQPGPAAPQPGPAAPQPGPGVPQPNPAQPQPAQPNPAQPPGGQAAGANTTQREARG